MKHYEELAGAQGRERNFRPNRVAAQTLFGASPPDVYFDDERLSLINLSATGIGARPVQPSGDGLNHIAARGVLRLSQAGRQLFRGAAQIVHKTKVDGKDTVGFRLQNQSLDLENLRRDNGGACALSAITNISASRAPEDYKLYCADFLYYYGECLHIIERDIEPIEHLLSREEAERLALDLADQIRPLWREILRRGAEVSLTHHRDKHARARIKNFTERTVLPHFLEGESISRSYNKPLGYPGDFIMMNHFYDFAPVGDTVRARFTHLLCVMGGEAVRSRMDKLVEILADAASEFSADDPIRATSIGCGPARELALLHAASDSRRWSFTLVDQEPLALEHALGRARSLVGEEKITARALQASFREMIEPAGLGTALTRQHIIYSSGLVDYLSPLMARRLVSRLYQLVEPGGTVIIGNVNDKDTGLIWSCEYFLDWSMNFRNETEMLDMAADLPGEAAVTLRQDSSDAILFLVIKKPR